jgi:hypothetical protein
MRIRNLVLIVLASVGDVLQFRTGARSPEGTCCARQVKSTPIWLS